ncbi:MAG: contractile injection system tape measure protein [Verrucomicrobiota bacterium]
MGTNHRHIINKQIIEVHIPKTANAHDMQNQISSLYRERFIPVIDKQLSEHYGSDERHYQVEKLTIDLGEVHVREIATVFPEKLAQAITSCQARELPEDHAQANGFRPHSTPLKVLAYYLVSGILPWWAEDTTKAYLHEQLEELLKAPDKTFKELLGQLPFHRVCIDRFFNTFTAEQVLRSLQLLTAIPLKNLSEMKKKLVDRIRKNLACTPGGLTDFSIEKAFWKATFDQVRTARDYSELESRSIRQALQALGINPTSIDRWVGAEKEKLTEDLSAIRQLIARLKTQSPKRAFWPQFFHELSMVLNRAAIQQINTHLLEELKRLLEGLDELWNKSMHQGQEVQQATRVKELPDRFIGDRSGASVQTLTEAHLQATLARHLEKLKAATSQIAPASAAIEKLLSEFEDTATITIGNAGLVILWPFLLRFFENLNLITDQSFHDRLARDKAVCALQYLADEEEAGLFEGMLALNKVLCGIPLEDTVEPLSLSAEEQAAAEGLLHSVISRGPHWKNLSLNGFRTSYLQREGLLRTRDGHWLLQVKKETYDVTLEKLPWGFSVVKLPWMHEPLMVEWIS